MSKLHGGPIDPIERRALVMIATIGVSEVNDAIIQLIDFFPPSASPFPLTDVIKKIREYIRKIVLTGCNISINLLMFDIQVKIVPGHSIEVFIRRVLPDTKTDQSIPPEQADYTVIYSGEWR